MEMGMRIRLFSVEKKEMFRASGSVRATHPHIYPPSPILEAGPDGISTRARPASFLITRDLKRRGRNSDTHPALPLRLIDLVILIPLAPA